jgi:hypothetical protein
LHLRHHRSIEEASGASSENRLFIDKMEFLVRSGYEYQENQ